MFDLSSKMSGADYAVEAAAQNDGMAWKIATGAAYMLVIAAGLGLGVVLDFLVALSSGLLTLC
jgi:hypothetical protein